MKLTHHKSLVLASIVTLSAANAVAAGECSRSDIDHYLDKGFNLPQIMKLCGDSSAAEPARKAAIENNTSIPLSNLLVFLQTALDAEKVEVTPKDINIHQDRCFPYGEEGFTGILPSACMSRTIRIARKGLKIGDVVESKFIFRDGKLIVSGEIEQSFDKLDTLKKRAKKEFLEKYPPHLNTFDVPVKKSMKRQEVADALEKLAK
ncbi:MAG TPA: hypothetical protein ENJ35_06050 [Gammaproteobacteria bacterium]|nr:hypothetical protein [Gammaproteobacteria bacterium]